MKTKTTASKKTKSRHGQHDEDLVGFSGYITPMLKAIAQVTANERKTTMMDLVRDGIINQAFASGVVDKDGKPTAKFAPVVSAYVDVYITRKQNRNGKGE